MSSNEVKMSRKKFFDTNNSNSLQLFPRLSFEYNGVWWKTSEAIGKSDGKKKRIPLLTVPFPQNNETTYKMVKLQKAFNIKRIFRNLMEICWRWSKIYEATKKV